MYNTWKNHFEACGIGHGDDSETYVLCIGEGMPTLDSLTCLTP